MSIKWKRYECSNCWRRKNNKSYCLNKANSDYQVETFTPCEHFLDSRGDRALRIVK